VRDSFAEHLETFRRRQAYELIAWVIMPEHVHLALLPALPDWPVKRILHALKQPFAQRVLRRWRAKPDPILSRLVDRRGRIRFWQRGGGYDRNIYSELEVREKIEYIHGNPQRRGLVRCPLEWEWSSARWYDGDRTGIVKVDPVI
jgi:putative transposase